MPSPQYGDLPVWFSASARDDAEDHTFESLAQAPAPFPQLTNEVPTFHLDSTMVPESIKEAPTSEIMAQTLVPAPSPRVNEVPMLLLDVAMTSEPTEAPTFNTLAQAPAPPPQLNEVPTPIPQAPAFSAQSDNPPALDGAVAGSLHAIVAPSGYQLLTIENAPNVKKLRTLAKKG